MGQTKVAEEGRSILTKVGNILAFGPTKNFGNSMFGPRYIHLPCIITMFYREIMVGWLYLGPEIEFSKSNQ